MKADVICDSNAFSIFSKKYFLTEMYIPEVGGKWDTYRYPIFGQLQGCTFQSKNIFLKKLKKR
jgi:hypothetical protein